MIVPSLFLLTLTTNKRMLIRASLDVELEMRRRINLANNGGFPGMEG